MKDKVIIFRLDEPLSERLRVYASQHHMALSVVIRLAVEEYLDSRKAPASEPVNEVEDGAGADS